MRSNPSQQRPLHLRQHHHGHVTNISFTCCFRYSYYDLCKTSREILVFHCFNKILPEFDPFSVSLGIGGDTDKPRKERTSSVNIANKCAKRKTPRKKQKKNAQFRCMFSVFCDVTIRALTSSSDAVIIIFWWAVYDRPCLFFL